MLDIQGLYRSIGLCILVLMKKTTIFIGLPETWVPSGASQHPAPLEAVLQRTFCTRSEAEHPVLTCSSPVAALQHHSVALVRRAGSEAQATPSPQGPDNQTQNDAGPNYILHNKHNHQASRAAPVPARHQKAPAPPPPEAAPHIYAYTSIPVLVCNDATWSRRARRTMRYRYMYIYREREGVQSPRSIPWEYL